MIEWTALDDSDIHGIKRGWTLYYRPLRNRRDYMLAKPDHYRGKRATWLRVDEGLQTDWYVN